MSDDAMDDSTPARDFLVHESDLPWTDQAHGARFRCRRKKLGEIAGSRRLGASLYEVPPGARAWPYHAHFANEEAIYVLEGSGTMRHGEREYPVRAGDYVALLAGQSGAHQLINTGSSVLRYLCVSTMTQPEVVTYPDADKIAIRAGAIPGNPPGKTLIAKAFRAKDEVDYWDGEE